MNANHPLRKREAVAMLGSALIHWVNLCGLFFSVIVKEGFVGVFISLEMAQFIRRPVTKNVKMTPITAEQA